MLTDLDQMSMITNKDTWMIYCNHSINHWFSSLIQKNLNAMDHSFDLKEAKFIILISSLKSGMPIEEPQILKIPS